MSFWSKFRAPSPEDYDTHEEYEETLDAYERAEDQALDEAEEAYHEREI